MSTDDYEVGYGRPPKAHRFRPGLSGNPQGRPRRARTMPEIVAKVRDECVTITLHGKQQKVSILEAALRKSIANVFKSSNPRHLEKLLEILEQHGVAHTDVLREENERLVAEFDKKFLDYLDRTHPGANPELVEKMKLRQLHENAIIQAHPETMAKLRRLWKETGRDPIFRGTESSLQTQLSGRHLD